MDLQWTRMDLQWPCKGCMDLECTWMDLHGIDPYAPGMAQNEPGMHLHGPGSALAQSEPGMHQDAPGMDPNGPVMHQDEPGMAPNAPG